MFSYFLESTWDSGRWKNQIQKITENTAAFLEPFAFGVSPEHSDAQTNSSRDRRSCKAMGSLLCPKYPLVSSNMAGWKILNLNGGF